LIFSFSFSPPPNSLIPLIYYFFGRKSSIFYLPTDFAKIILTAKKLASAWLVKFSSFFACHFHNNFVKFSVSHSEALFGHFEFRLILKI